MKLSPDGVQSKCCSQNISSGFHGRRIVIQLQGTYKNITQLRLNELPPCRTFQNPLDSQVRACRLLSSTTDLQWGSDLRTELVIAHCACVFEPFFFLTSLFHQVLSWNILHKVLQYIRCSKEGLSCNACNFSFLNFETCQQEESTKFLFQSCFTVNTSAVYEQKRSSIRTWE